MLSNSSDERWDCSCDEIFIPFNQQNAPKGAYPTDEIRLPRHSPARRLVPVYSHKTRSKGMQNANQTVSRSIHYRAIHGCFTVPLAAWMQTRCLYPRLMRLACPCQADGHQSRFTGFTTRLAAFTIFAANKAAMAGYKSTF